MSDTCANCGESPQGDMYSDTSTPGEERQICPKCWDELYLERQCKDCGVALRHASDPLIVRCAACALKMFDG